MKIPAAYIAVALSATGSHAFSPSSAFAPTRARPNLDLMASVEATEEASATAADPGDRDILVRAARGEEVERTPVWLMRQAGRYMAAFREYSNKYPFRQRSETPDFAVELSLQPYDGTEHRACRPIDPHRRLSPAAQRWGGGQRWKGGGAGRHA